MAVDSFKLVLNEIALVHHHFAGMLDTGFLIFARMMGFALIAPVLGRKDVPFTMKLSTALLLTIIMVWAQPAHPAESGMISSDNVIWYTMQIMSNVTVGLLIGFIGAVIMEAVSSAGSLMNNQIGLSSAMMFDPSTRQQVALLEKLFAFIGLMLFFQLGGGFIGSSRRSTTALRCFRCTPSSRTLREKSTWTTWCRLPAMR